MQAEFLEGLVKQAEQGSAGDPDFVRDMLVALRTTADGATVDAAALCSVEAAVELVDRVLPNWRIVLDRSGLWHCTLREGSARDDDELLGLAQARSPALAVTAALLAVAARRARGYR